MDLIIISILAVTIIGFVCAIILSIASKYLSTPTNETIEKLIEALPGSNCGACGYVGCHGYAQAMFEENAETGLCTPGGENTASILANILNQEVQKFSAKAAYIACGGDNTACAVVSEYTGIQTCYAAHKHAQTIKSCIYGCIGFGDCAVACPNNAIILTNGLAHVTIKCCTGCGLCTNSCPRKLIQINNKNIETFVSCSNQETAVAARTRCSKCCLGCKKCERNCPEHAITVQNNVAVINYEQCINCWVCAEGCPTACITNFFHTKGTI